MVFRSWRSGSDQSPAAESPTSAAGSREGYSASGTRYRLSEGLVATGEDFFVQTNAGHRAFKVDGKSIRLRDAIRFEDMQGTGLCEVRAGADLNHNTLVVVDPHGQLLATLRRERITPVRDRFTIELAGGPRLEVLGNVATHEFEVAGPFGNVAEVSRRWFQVRDSYGVQIGPGQHDVLILAAVVGIDQMINDARY